MLAFAAPMKVRAASPLLRALDSWIRLPVCHITGCVTLQKHEVPQSLSPEVWDHMASGLLAAALHPAAWFNSTRQPVRDFAVDVEAHPMDRRGRGEVLLPCSLETS